MALDPPEATRHALADLRRATCWAEREEARRALRDRRRYLLQHPSTERLLQDRQAEELRLLEEVLKS